MSKLSKDKGNTRTVKGAGVPITKVIDSLSGPSGGIGTYTRDTHLILLGYCLNPSTRGDTLERLLRPLGMPETEGLFRSLEGDGKDLRDWLKRRRIEANTNAIDDVLESVNKNTAERMLSEDCTKAWASVRMGGDVKNTLSHLRKAVETAERNMEILKGNDDETDAIQATRDNRGIATGGNGGLIKKPAKAKPCGPSGKR